MVANTLRPRLASLDSREFIKAPATLSALVCKLDPNAIVELQTPTIPQFGGEYSRTSPTTWSAKESRKLASF